MIARVAVLVGLLSAASLGDDISKVPGVVIDYSPASSGIYMGSPGIVIRPDGSYLASHDEFGPKSQYYGQAVTRVFRSDDKGRTWAPISKIDGCLWASLFLHGDALYLWGTNREYGEMLIRRSIDRWRQNVERAGGTLEGAFPLRTGAGGGSQRADLARVGRSGGGEEMG